MVGVPCHCGPWVKWRKLGTPGGPTATPQEVRTPAKVSSDTVRLLRSFRRVPEPHFFWSSKMSFPLRQCLVFSFLDYKYKASSLQKNCWEIQEAETEKLKPHLFRHPERTEGFSVVLSRPCLCGTISSWLYIEALWWILYSFIRISSVSTSFHSIIITAWSSGAV